MESLGIDQLWTLPRVGIKGTAIFGTLNFTVIN